MNATELQTILDREGVPVEARAEMERCDFLGWYTVAHGQRQYIDNSTAENAHIGAMVRWLLSKGCHSFEFDTDDECTFLTIYSRAFTEPNKRNTPTEFVLFARACGAVAKEHMNVPPIDWSKFKKYEPGEVQCACGAVWHTQHKLVTVEGSLRVVTQTPCPKCLSNCTVRRASSPVERWTLGGSEE